jgi:hypothetical protein
MPQHNTAERMAAKHARYVALLRECGMCPDSVWPRDRRPQRKYQYTYSPSNFRMILRRWYLAERRLQDVKEALHWVWVGFRDAEAAYLGAIEETSRCKCEIACLRKNDEAHNLKEAL